VARACPSRLSSRLDRGRGPRETRPPASRVKPPSSPRASVLYWHRARSGAPEDAPGDPTPFQASALLQHSRVMLLDPGDPRGWLYSEHAGKTAASDGVTKGLACIAIYRALMINRQKRSASRGFDCRGNIYASNKLIARTFLRKEKSVPKCSLIFLVFGKRKK